MGDIVGVVVARIANPRQLGALISSDKQVQLKLDRDSINNITQLLLEYKSFINDEIIY
jgi:hypothetical protein